MSITKKLAVLREQHYGLDKLPETIRVPALGERRDETVKPVGTASIDELAFALIGLNERASALYREIDAVRRAALRVRGDGRASCCRSVRIQFCYRSWTSDGDCALKKPRAQIGSFPQHYARVPRAPQRIASVRAKIWEANPLGSHPEFRNISVISMD